MKLAKKAKMHIHSNKREEDEEEAPEYQVTSDSENEEEVPATLKSSKQKKKSQGHRESSVESEDEQEGGQKKKNHNKYRKDKPWDDPNIDHWKIEEFKPGDMSGPLLEESSFATLFPKYREKYIKEVWPMVKRKLAEFGVKADLDLVEGSMTISTTHKTWDPYIIIKARDLIKLLARSVPAQQALRILDDGVFCDIIKIRGLVRSKEKFVKRRHRLIGPNGNTLKSLELLTGCYIMVQGSTVAVIGDFRGLKTLRKVIEDTMYNIHPIYHIKELMIKRELAKDENLKGENWDRFLPQFKKVLGTQKDKIKELRKKRKENKAKTIEGKKKKKEKNEGELVIPEPTPRKEDLAMMSGEYFLTGEEKKKREKKNREKAQEEKKKEKMIQRNASLQAPSIQEEIKMEKKKHEAGATVEELKKQFMKGSTLKKMKL